MKWNVTSIDSEEMKVQLIFDEPLYVSFSGADILVVTFADEELFISNVSGATIPPKHRQIRRPIMH